MIAKATDEGGYHNTALLHTPSFCQLFTYISTDRRKETMNHIHVEKTPNKMFEVQIAYSNIDSHDDKIDAFADPDVWQVITPASSSINAIITAMHIVQISRAETMTDWLPPEEVLEGKDSFTLEELKVIRQAAEDTNVFKHWLDIEPTSIQGCLAEDSEKLRDMTISNLDKMTQDVGNQAEDYLREVDNGNA